jgi:hypothetical protein
MTHHTNYEDAYDAAVDRARLSNLDIGLERACDGFTTFVLPAPAHRAGSELRCEVVTPTHPMSERAYAEANNKPQGDDFDPERPE